MSFPYPSGVSVQVGQNPPLGSGDRVQTMLIFTVFIVWWPWKLGQGHHNLFKSLTIPMLQYMKFGQNQSFGSSDRCCKQVFLGQKSLIRSAGVTLKMRSKSPKSKHVFPLPIMCLILVNIYPLVQEVRVQTRSKADADRICTRSNMSPLQLGGHNYCWKQDYWRQVSSPPLYPD